MFRYGYGLRIGRWAAGLILLANVITVGLALVSLDVVPNEGYREISPGIGRRIATVKVGRRVRLRPYSYS